MNRIHTDIYRVNSFSVDASGRLALPVLLSFFQESAYRHAESMGFGYSHLGERKMFWVVSRLFIRILRFPLWGEDVSLATWSKGISRMFALRDFLLDDMNGGRLMEGTSSWLVLDAETRRLQRLEPLFDGLETDPSLHAVREEAGKVAVPVNPVLTGEYRVRYGDIDVNGHMNNSRYVQCVLDGYPFEHFPANRLALLEINFLSETLYDDRIRIFSSSGNEPEPGIREDLHLLSREGDGKDLCRIRTVWAPVSRGASGTP